MDKIRQLLEQCGVKPELTDKICESLEQYSTKLREKFEGEYNERTQAAKRVCVEEVEAYKRDLARHLQIYCEAKAAHIERQLSQQTAVREGEAMGILEQVSSLLDGVPAGGDQALRAEVEKLKKQNSQLREQNSQAVKKANNLNELSERVLKRSRYLEARQLELENNQRVVGGGGGAGRPRPATKPVTEGAAATTRRIDTGRTGGGAPATTRRTLAENQDRRTPIDNRRTNTVAAQPIAEGKVGLTPDQIAEQIEE